MLTSTLIALYTYHPGVPFRHAPFRAAAGEGGPEPRAGGGAHGCHRGGHRRERKEYDEQYGDEGRPGEGTSSSRRTFIRIRITH